MCSDVLSRGIDVRGRGVGLVVSYDAAAHPKTYVHRAGRTARAGRPGTALTLLERQDVRFFGQMRTKAALPPLKPEPIAAHRAAAAAAGELRYAGAEAVGARCGRCLAELEAVLAHEALALLQPHTPVEALPPPPSDDGAASAAGLGTTTTTATRARAAGQLGRAQSLGWGQQLYELQRAQIERRRQQAAQAQAQAQAGAS
eukprot:COSAG01_NODE_14255_length_1476_cov_39.284677_1_plen_201_part_00